MEGVNLDIKPDQMEGVNEKNSPSRKKENSDMTPTNTFEIGSHRSSGGVRTGCIRTTDVMEMSMFNNCDGVVPRRQVGTMPGHHDPSQATGTSDSRQETGIGQSRATSFNLRMLHWNAEGVRNKKLELQVLLKERNIAVCFIQDTYLNSSHRLSIRGYETFRRDRKIGQKKESSPL